MWKMSEIGDDSIFDHREAIDCETRPIGRRTF